MMHPDNGSAERPRTPHRQFRLEAETTALLRQLMTRMAMYKACPRKDCRRARVCAAPAVTCFWLNREALHETLLPALRRAAANADSAEE